MFPIFVDASDYHDFEGYKQTLAKFGVDVEYREIEENDAILLPTEYKNSILTGNKITDGRKNQSYIAVFFEKTDVWFFDKHLGID